MGSRQARNVHPEERDRITELMLRETGEVKRRVIDQALRTTDDTREGLRRFLRSTLDELSTRCGAG